MFSSPRRHRLQPGPGAIAATVLAVAGSLGGAALAAPACTKEAITAMAPAGTIIDEAIPTALPVPHCLINGHIITTDPGPNQVNFRLQLPDTGFNGRYYMAGLGGAAGSVPTNSQTPAGHPITTGWAMAGTKRTNWGIPARG